jgi:hypothetical protein
MDKILKIQSQIGTLSKDKENPFFKSKYFDINQILAQLQPLLDEHGLTVVQPLDNIEGKPALSTIVYDGDQEVLNYTTPLPENDDPQKIGSAITYFRRYALQSLFMLQADDDDANSAKPGKVVSKKTTPRVKTTNDLG